MTESPDILSFSRLSDDCALESKRLATLQDALIVDGTGWSAPGPPIVEMQALDSARQTLAVLSTILGGLRIAIAEGGKGDEAIFRVLDLPAALRHLRDENAELTGSDDVSATETDQDEFWC